MSQDIPKKLDQQPDFAGNDLGELQLKVVRPTGSPQVQSAVASSAAAQPVDHSAANSSTPGQTLNQAHGQAQATAPRPTAKLDSQLVDDDERR